ncbi:hypothetical protein ACYCEF_004594 [Salmonella enterica subsp. enterica serovar Javiana]
MTLTLEGRAWESSWAALWGERISPLFHRYWSAISPRLMPILTRFQADSPEFAPIASLVRSNSD